MLDFEIQRCTRRCAKTERDLQPGEVYYSVLLPEGAAVVRYDYSEAGWEGPPEGAIGFWRARMPAADNTKVQWAPNDVMLDYFVQLEEEPAKADVRFVLALLLIRRKLLRLEDTETRDGQEWMVLHCPRDETEYRIANAALVAQRAKEIQDELAQLLFSDAGECGEGG